MRKTQALTEMKKLEEDHTVGWCISQVQLDMLNLICLLNLICCIRYWICKPEIQERDMNHGVINLEIINI